MDFGVSLVRDRSRAFVVLVSRGASTSDGVRHIVVVSDSEGVKAADSVRVVRSGEDRDTEIVLRVPMPLTR